MEFLKKYHCKICHRETYNGRPLKPNVKELDGLELELQAMWLQEDEDPYPGEWAMGIVDDEERRKFMVDYNISWVASGDVVVLAN